MSKQIYFVETKNTIQNQKILCGDNKHFVKIKNFMETKNTIWKQNILCRNKKYYSETKNILWKQKYFVKKKTLLFTTTKFTF